MINPVHEFEKSMPATARIVGPKFAADLTAIGEFNPSDLEAVEALLESLQAKPELLRVLIAGWSYGADRTCSQLEHDLSLLQARAPAQKVRAAFGTKLATSQQIDDVLFEIAVCASASGWFDAGSLDFETPRVGSSKNTDATGKRGGRQARIEIKLIHDTVVSPWDVEGGEAQVRTRATVDRHDWNELKDANPAGVFTSQDLKRDPQTHKDTPLSTVIWQKIDEKRAQCEPGSLNVVAIGLMPRLSDRAVDEALKGATIPVISREGGSPSVMRKANGPFVEDPSGGGSFAIVSAVWEIGFTGNKGSLVHPNPNATVSGSGADWADLAARGTSRFTGQGIAS